MMPIEVLLTTLTNSDFFPKCVAQLNTYNSKGVFIYLNTESNCSWDLTQFFYPRQRSFSMQHIETITEKPHMVEVQRALDHKVPNHKASLCNGT